MRFNLSIEYIELDVNGSNQYENANREIGDPRLRKRRVRTQGKRVDANQAEATARKWAVAGYRACVETSYNPAHEDQKKTFLGARCGSGCFRGLFSVDITGAEGVVE